MQQVQNDSSSSSSVSCLRPVAGDIPMKRKLSSDGTQSNPEGPMTGPRTLDFGKSEYETGRVMCEDCRKGISFRDEETGGFTLKHWDAHRLSCGFVAQPGPETVIYTPESTAEALANPPAKRRRAKRTEEERIDYLRSDPYVAQFEAYRVLCASCDKWIRLRPNSTYCSIPWDAHRKSCLAKKIGAKNSEPDARKFDSDRVLCKICDKWLPINSSDHSQAIQKWLQHRSTCQKVSSGVPPSDNEQASSKHSRTPSNVPPPSPQHLALAASTSHVMSISSPDRSGEGKISVGQGSGKLPPPPYMHTSQPSPPPSLQRDLNPYNFQPAHESRRRNAEQRAATLRADPLIGHVEPNRVFCSLCQKWVQLRQDSSYCAYPWLQHRGKCFARQYASPAMTSPPHSHTHSLTSQRRVQRAAEVEAIKAMAQDDDIQEDELMTDEGGVSDSDPESEEGVNLNEDRLYREQGHDPRTFKRSSSHIESKAMDLIAAGGRHGGPSWVSINRTWPEDDEEGEINADSHPASSKFAYGSTRRTRPAGLADLDSPSGRKQFIASSIEHLFRTTYEVTDDMTISSVLTYLNAAMPPDKYEDFDTSEVTKAVAALHASGRLVFEGDMLRRIE